MTRAAFACPGETLVEQSQILNLVDLRPAPSDRRTGSTGAANLVEEQLGRAFDDAEVVRLGTTRQPVQRERDQSPFVDRAAQGGVDIANRKFVDDRHRRIVAHGRLVHAAVAQRLCFIESTALVDCRRASMIIPSHELQALEP